MVSKIDSETAPQANPKSPVTSTTDLEKGVKNIQLDTTTPGNDSKPSPTETIKPAVLPPAPVPTVNAWAARKQSQQGLDVKSPEQSPSATATEVQTAKKQESKPTLPTQLQDLSAWPAPADIKSATSPTAADSKPVAKVSTKDSGVSGEGTESTTKKPKEKWVPYEAEITHNRPVEAVSSQARRGRRTGPGKQGKRTGKSNRRDTETGMTKDDDNEETDAKADSTQKDQTNKSRRPGSDRSGARRRSGSNSSRTSRVKGTTGEHASGKRFPEGASGGQQGRRWGSYPRGRHSYHHGQSESGLAQREESSSKVSTGKGGISEDAVATNPEGGDSATRSNTTTGGRFQRSYNPRHGRQNHPFHQRGRRFQGRGGGGHRHGGNYYPHRHMPPPIPSTQGVDMATLMEYVRHQVEFYFSVENLVKDVFFRSQMDEEGYVLLSLVANFNRVKALTTDMAVLREALGSSTILDITDDKLRLKEDWQRWLLPKESPVGQAPVVLPTPTGSNMTSIQDSAQGSATQSPDKVCPIPTVQITGCTGEANQGVPLSNATTPVANTVTSRPPRHPKLGLSGGPTGTLGGNPVGWNSRRISGTSLGARRSSRSRSRSRASREQQPSGALFDFEDDDGDDAATSAMQWQKDSRTAARRGSSKYSPGDLSEDFNDGFDMEDAGDFDTDGDYFDEDDVDDDLVASLLLVTEKRRDRTHLSFERKSMNDEITEIINEGLYYYERDLQRGKQAKDHMVSKVGTMDQEKFQRWQQTTTSGQGETPAQVGRRLGSGVAPSGVTGLSSKNIIVQQGAAATNKPSKTQPTPRFIPVKGQASGARNPSRVSGMRRTSQSHKFEGHGFRPASYNAREYH
ncbi:hypothetical protein IWQ62_004603, partial [Dispira parvispora]